jgi:hypothetical protein
MTILAFPTLTRGTGQFSFRLRGLTQTHSSPFDGTTQTLTQPGARWAVSATWPSLMESDRRTMEAFLASLLGRAGRFTFGPIHAPRRATGTGTVLVNGGSQTGSTLNVDGFGASHQAFVVGDFLSYVDPAGRSRLHMATATVAANGSGEAAVAIVPPLRTSPANNAAVEIVAPLGVFMLTDDEFGLTTRPPLIGSVSLEMVEALV